ncbi:MAG: DUF3847 domain-containing protein [Lachnospiraceae bacterium]|nr:DUF3847 domain-containing protein [Lachnospiraceae bacterium]
MENNKKLQKLRTDLEQARMEKNQAEHQLKRAENRLKYRESMSRKERTHRLIVVGAIVEQYFPELKELTEIQMSAVFGSLDLEVFHQALKEAILQNGKEVDA